MVIISKRLVGCWYGSWSVWLVTCIRWRIYGVSITKFVHILVVVVSSSVGCRAGIFISTETILK